MGVRRLVRSTVPWWIGICRLVAAAGCEADQTQQKHRSFVEPAAAAARCKQALEQVRGTGAQAQRLIAGGCRDLFVKEDCRNAWGRFDQRTETRARDVAAACAAAYCPALQPPRPELCGRDPAALPPRQLAAAWNELLPAILRHDLGPELSNEMREAFKATAERAAAGHIKP